MTPDFYLATEHGLVTCAWEGEIARVLDSDLQDDALTSVIATPSVILAGTLRGIFLSDDNGHSWRASDTGLTTPHIRWLAQAPGLLLAGVESAGIFTSRDNGLSWREAPEVPPLRAKHKWFLPYSSGAGCVRGFAIHGARLYAAVEVGGVLRSDDNGETWRLVAGSDGNPNLDSPPEPLIYPDVHSLSTHSSSPDLVFAPTGGGFYKSADGGQTWTCLYDGYVRAVWVDPADPDHLLLGPADGVDARGRIEQTRDGGRTWLPASTGLSTPWRRHMVERFLQVNDHLLAVLSNGQLLAAPLATLAWGQILPEVKGVRAVAHVQTQVTLGA